MPFSIISQTAGQGHIKVSGLLTVNDLLDLQALAREGLEKFGDYRVLIELDGFQGWSHEAGWENTSWLPVQPHQHIRMALVGDEKWRDDVFMFTGQPMRGESIRLFSQGKMAEAQAWLGQNFE